MEDEEDIGLCIICKTELTKEELIYSCGDWYCQECYYEANA